MMGLEDKNLSLFLILIIFIIFQGCTSENEGNDPMIDLRKHVFMVGLGTTSQLVYLLAFDSFIFMIDA